LLVNHGDIFFVLILNILLKRTSHTEAESNTVIFFNALPLLVV